MDRKRSSMKPQSEWDVEEDIVTPHKVSEWDEGPSKPKKSSVFRPQSEWDIDQEDKQRPQSEWGDGSEKSKAASSFRPHSEWDDGGGGNKETSIKKSKAASSFRPQSEWDIENEEGKLRPQSEWNVDTKERKASSFRPHSEWNAPKPSFNGDSFILGKSVYTEEEKRAQSEWNAGGNTDVMPAAVDKQPTIKTQSEWNDGKNKKKKDKKKSEVSKSRTRTEKGKEEKGASFRPQSEWNDGGDKQKSKGRSERDASFRPQSEWNDGGDKQKSRGRSERDASFRPQSEWNDGGDKQKSKGRSERDASLRPQSEWNDGGEGIQSDESKNDTLSLPRNFLALVDQEEPCDPIRMFSSNRMVVIQSLQLADFDENTGLPYSMGGAPLTPNQLKELKLAQKSMEKRFKEATAMRSECDAVLKGNSQLKMGTVKMLAKELARLEAVEDFVLDPRTMYMSPHNFSEHPMTGRKKAVALFGGMFSNFDEMGRPSAGRVVSGKDAAAPLSQMLKGVLIKLHKQQSQKFLDFYKPRLDEFRSRDISNYFKSGEYTGKFKDFNDDNLPLTDRRGRELSHLDKNKYVKEKLKVAQLWEVEEQKLSKDMDAIAKLYNQTSSKKNLVKGALNAYGGRLGRTSLHQDLKASGGSHLKGFKGPQEIRVLLSTSKAGMHMGNDQEGKLYVTKVLLGGAAFEMGIKVNDRVLAVNGVDFEMKEHKEAKLELSEMLKKAVGSRSSVSLDIRREEAWTLDNVESLNQYDAETNNFYHAFRQLRTDRLPTKDEMHFLFESDMWSAIIVFLVVFDAAIAPFRSEVLVLDVFGILLTLFFCAEISSRMYLWRYVRGNYFSFFFELHPIENIPFKDRIQLLNIIDVCVVFVDMLLLIVDLATRATHGNFVSLVRIVRVGRTIRYFRILKNIRSSRLYKAFKRNAHIIYHELLAWRYLLWLSALVIGDAVLIGLYGAGHLDDDEAPTHQALGFGMFVSFYCLIEYFLRIACHKAVIGEVKTFYYDALNLLDTIVTFVDFVLLMTLFSSETRNPATTIKVFKVTRLIKSLKLMKRCNRCVHKLTKRSKLFRKLHNILFPPRLTAQQKEDLELYGDYFTEKEDDDIEIGAEVTKLGSVLYDDDEIDAAWEVIKYDPITHGDLVNSNATQRGMVNPSMTKNINRHIQLSEGDEFMFNKLTGATKWDIKQHVNLLDKQEESAAYRLVENERLIALREMQHLGREEHLSQLLRSLRQMEDNQLEAVFGQRLPFKHAGRYEVVHRGYSTEGDGYGRRKMDCFIGQGKHSRTFCCSDSLGQFSNIVVKVSRNTEKSMFAQRGEAGILRSLEKMDEELRRKYFIMIVDSFDFGVKDNRFAMVFEQHGPSLAYVLSLYCRPPKVDPLFGKRGLNELDAEFLTSVAPWVASGSKDVIRGTGYLSEPPRLKRKGPVPRAPLPVTFAMDVLRQVCEAVTFLHEKAGMVHGDINPDNIVMVQRHDKHVLKKTVGESETTPYVPSSSQIKLVDLNCSCFIPIGLTERRPGIEDYDDVEQKDSDPSTISPLTSSSAWMKKKADNKDVMPETALNYRAPELDVCHSGWNGGIDVWSIGCLLVEMYSGMAGYQGGMIAAEHEAPDTDSGLAVQAAVLPSLSEIGRSPLFKAESPFEHLAMVERCVGTLPPSVYERWSNIESPAMVGPYARARVVSVPPLMEALEANRSALALDQEARLALTRHHMGERESDNLEDMIGGVLGLTKKKEEDNAAYKQIEEIMLEQKSCEVEPWRKEAIAELANLLLNPDMDQRIKVRKVLEHRALQTGMFAGFGVGMF